VLVDALAARLVLKPPSVDVIVASNLFGNSLSDLAVVVAGRRVHQVAAAARPPDANRSRTRPLHALRTKENINSAPTPAERGYGSTVRGGAWSVLAPGQGLVHGPPGQMPSRRPGESGAVRTAAASQGCVK
jgi:tartrate dehydrogenase/decarboxylase / D-malate dehydrogenase